MMRRGLLRGLLGMVYGGLPTPRPDQGQPSSDAGVAPGASSGITRARQVIVFGPGVSGVFVYNGNPALGNPPIAYIAPPGVTKDPSGNTLPQTSGGFTSVSGTQWAALFAAALQFSQASDIAVAQVAGGGGSLSLSSGQGPVSGLGASGLQLLQSLTAAGAPRIVAGSNSSSAPLLGFGQGAALPNAGDVDRPSLSWPPGVRHLVEFDNDDGNAYALQHLYSESATDEPISLTTFSFVCGGSVPVFGTAGQPGRYRIRATLTCQQGPNAVADNYRIGFTGTISQVRARARFVSTTAGGQPVFTAFTTSNNGLLASQAVGANVVYFVDIDAFITVTSSGQIGIQAAMSGAGDTFTVLALSVFELFRG